MLSSSSLLLLLHLSFVILLMMVLASPLQCLQTQKCLLHVNMVDNSKYVPPQGSHEWTVTHGLVDYCIASCGNLTGSFFANRDDLDLLMPNNQEGSLHFYWLVKPDGFYISLGNSQWDQ